MFVILFFRLAAPDFCIEFFYFNAAALLSGREWSNAGDILPNNAGMILGLLWWS